MQRHVLSPLPFIFVAIKDCIMSKQVEGMRRMLLILNKLRPGKQFIPRRELLDYVNDSMEERYGYQRITGRTLERDIADIDELFGIGISFNRTR